MRKPSKPNIAATQPATPAPLVFEGFRYNEVAHQAAMRFAKRGSWPSAREVASELLKLPYNAEPVEIATHWIIEQGTTGFVERGDSGQSWFQVNKKFGTVIAHSNVINIDRIIAAADVASANLKAVIASISGISTIKLALMQVAKLVSEIPQARFAHSEGTLTQIGIDDPRYIYQYRGSVNEVGDSDIHVTQMNSSKLARTKKP